MGLRTWWSRRRRGTSGPIVRRAPGSTRRTIFALHGHGADAEQIETLVLPKLPRGATCVSPQGPVALSDGSRSWLSEDRLVSLTRPDQLTMAALASSLTRLEGEIDALDARVVDLVGYSLGGTLAGALAIRRPRRYRRVAVLSGLPVLRDATRGAGPLPRFFVGTGALDPMLPEALVRRGVTELRQMGAQVTFRAYPAPHVVTHQERANLATWLSGPALRRVEPLGT